jgi:lysozyme
MSDDALLIAMLIKHEGIMTIPYRCTAGKLTVGVGRNLDDVGITRDEAVYLLRNDIARVKLELEVVVPTFLELSHGRQNVLIDMCFNLGLSRFILFKKMIAAVIAGDFSTAADEMLASKWAEQVGKRATTLAMMMREG